MRNLGKILQQTSPRYYYYKGTRTYLEIDPELLLITFNEIKDPKDQISITNLVTPSQSLFIDMNEEDLIPEKYLFIKFDRKSALELTEKISIEHPEIENVGEVFIGEGNSKLALTNQVFIKVKDFSQPENVSEVFDRFGIIDQQSYGDNITLLTLDLKLGLDSLDVANSLFETGLFEFSEPNFIRLLTNLVYTPNDINYPIEWHIPRIRANSAWCWTKGENVKIGIMDSGINVSHPDLHPTLPAPMILREDRLGMMHTEPWWQVRRLR